MSSLSLFRPRPLALIAAVALAEAIAFVAQLLYGVRLMAPAGTLAPQPVAIVPVAIAIACLLPSVLGWALLAGLERRSRRGRTIWLGLALVVALASIVFGPLAGTGVEASDRITLLLMHAAVAGLVISVFYRSSSRGSGSRPRDAHAAHRPPVSTVPQAGPPVAFGVLYPREDIVAAFDDVNQARRAEAALQMAGIPDHDYDVLEPALVLEGRDLIERSGWQARLLALVSRLVSDDSRYMQEYWHDAEQGHSLLVVHAATPAVIERVRKVLSNHGARGMRHYGRFAVTELA